MTTSEIIKYLTVNKPEFERKFGVTKIGLFGSFSQGRNRQGSDIDIVVELKKPDLLSLVGIKQMIEEQLHANVDIVRYRNKMNQALKKRIDKDALYV
ncbi:MAG: nucleotidyltransferase domain-containing protein [Balneolaceae bacterium]